MLSISTIIEQKFVVVSDFMWMWKRWTHKNILNMLQKNLKNQEKYRPRELNYIFFCVVVKRIGVVEIS